MNISTFMVELSEPVVKQKYHKKVPAGGGGGANARQPYVGRRKIHPADLSVKHYTSAPGLRSCFARLQSEVCDTDHHDHASNHQQRSCQRTGRT